MTPEQKEQLKILYKNGQSYRSIARTLGVTPSSVSGTLDRLFKSGVVEHINNIRTIKYTIKKKSEPLFVREITKVNKVRPLFKPKLSWKEQERVSILEVKEWHCKWPIENEGKEIIFCGKFKTRGAYCNEHAALAYIRPWKLYKR